MKIKSILNFDNTNVVVLWYDFFTNADFINNIKDFSKAPYYTDQKFILVIIFTKTDVEQTDDDIINVLQFYNSETQKKRDDNQIVLVNLTKHNNGKEIPNLIKLLLLISQDNHSINCSQDLITLAEEVKDILDKISS